MWSKTEKEEIGNVLLRLEDNIFKRRAMYRGKKMWFSYWRYEKRVSGYRRQWGKNAEVDKKLAEKRVADIICQEKINWDECGQSADETERIKRALWEAEDLQEALYYSYLD